jgi:hypothetical protein
MYESVWVMLMDISFFGDMTVCRLTNIDRNFGEVSCPRCLQSGGYGGYFTRGKEAEA